MNKTKIFNAATKILCRAVSLEENRNLEGALVHYMNGISLLLVVRDSLPKVDNFYSDLNAKLKDYITHAESLKKQLNEYSRAISSNTTTSSSSISATNKAASCSESASSDDSNAHRLPGKREHLTLQFEAGESNHGYRWLFSRFLHYDGGRSEGDEAVTFVQIEEPYIQSEEQFLNFVHFCEVILRPPSKITKIFLKTGTPQDPTVKLKQKTFFEEFSEDLRAKCGVEIEIEFIRTLHDRKIRFSNGWIVKIGRGLDYLFPPYEDAKLGIFDFNFRNCRKTDVDIFHESAISNKNDFM